jgi:hypothetical protein
VIATLGNALVEDGSIVTTGFVPERFHGPQSDDHVLDMALDQIASEVRGSMEKDPVAGDDGS